MIRGQKTTLRAIEREDLPIFVRWFNDPEVRQYLAMYMPMSMAEEEKWKVWFSARRPATRSSLSRWTVSR